MGHIKTIVICEKPDAAARVARALDENESPTRKEVRGVPFFQCSRRDELIIVCSAIGHLYAVDSKGKTSRRSYPVWDYSWKPKPEVERNSARLMQWIQVISSLSRDADRFVNACDHDIEGSLIGQTILQYACDGAHRKASRMNFNTMTEKELRDSFKNIQPQLDIPMSEAGRCRHELDWLYGINLSRLLTEAALKQGRGYATLSAGRVQGPALSFVVAREKAIESFVPLPFWNIQASITKDGRKYKLEYSEETVPTLERAEKIVRECRNELLEVLDIKSEENRRTPPFPFDLSTLQAEAYRHFGYTSSRTMAVAEHLYLEALISYPRTSSQKLPPDIGYREILYGIASIRGYDRLTRKLLDGRLLRPNHGLREDPAHPAIYPTGESPKRALLGPEGKLLDLIVRRFMATFAEPLVRLSSTIILGTGSHKFLLKGSHVLSPGWTEFYQPYFSEEAQDIPELEIGSRVPLGEVDSLEKFTQPSPRFNPSSLLRKMEEEGIGTKATRADIIETLHHRRYIKNTRIEPTPLALAIIRLLERHCPLIVDAGFTAKLENLMEGIQDGSTTRRVVLAEALDHLRPVMLNLLQLEDDLGKNLSDAAIAQRTAAITFESRCQLCGSTLKIVKNRRSGKRFIGCSGKWDRGCSYSLPLPQFGTVSILRKKCRICGFQMIKAYSRGRRPLVSCPRCYATRAKNSAEKTDSPETAGCPMAGRLQTT